MYRSVKNFLYIISGSLLRILLFLCITATVVLIVFGNSKTLKTIMITTNSYSRFIPSVIESSKNNPQTAKSLPFDDPKITQIFTDSFSSNDLKNKTETFIDSTYSWLNKQTPELTFKIDFTKNKQTFSRELADYAFNRLDRLPVCKSNPTELDPLNAVCKPIESISKESKQAYETEIFNSDTFLQKTVLSQDDLPKNDKGQSIAKRLYFVPDIFIWLKRAPYILGVFILFLATDFILLSPRRRKGFNKLAEILASSGASIVLFPIIYNYILPYFSKSFDFSIQSDATSKIFNELINQLNNTVNFLFITIGTSLIIIGFFIYSAERLTRPRSKYSKIEKSAGLASSIKKPSVSPKSLKLKLNQKNTPVQSSENPKDKNTKNDKKYHNIFNKKEF